MSPSLYALAFVALSMGQIHRGCSPGKFFVWAGVCEWAGFVLVAALVGWWLPGSRLAAKWRIPTEPAPRSGGWFSLAQAFLAAVTAVLAAWISIDFSFDGMGADVALLGLSGRQAGNPAALMLIGTAMLMAWQSRGAWRAGWQYAAMAAGVLFTSSIGWARLDASPPSATFASPWFHRSVNLLISASMMTLLTGYWLARVFPGRDDWIARGRRAMPVFALLALLALAAVLLQGVILLARTGTG
jgi:hypothetical protein